MLEGLMTKEEKKLQQFAGNPENVEILCSCQQPTIQECDYLAWLKSILTRAIIYGRVKIIVE